jgi:UDP-glucose 4,6-dehydratase
MASLESLPEEVKVAAAEVFVPQRCLVTGAAGFILSAFVDRILDAYPHVYVVAYDIMDYCASERNLAGAFRTGRCKLIKGDIRNRGLLDYVLRTERIDSVVHGAACTHVCHSFNNSLQFTDVNVHGTHVVLEAVRAYNEEEKKEQRQGVARLLFCNTDEVYGSNEHQCKEDALLAPTNPYAASKMCGAAYCSAYIKSYNLPIIESRGNNVYGPRQFVDKVMPRFIRRLERGQTLTIQGDGKQLRSFMHVSDTAEALLCMLTRGKVHGIYNIESNDEITVIELAHRLMQAFGDEDEAARTERLEMVPDRPFNDQRYWVDGSRLREDTGFTPRVELETGLRETVKWYREHPTYWPNEEIALSPDFRAPTVER